MTVPKVRTPGGIRPGAGLLAALGLEPGLLVVVGLKPGLMAAIGPKPGLLAVLDSRRARTSWGIDAGIVVPGAEILEAQEHLWVLAEALKPCSRPQFEEKIYAPSLIDRKRSRSGSVVLPYIMSSTLWRHSTISVSSSAASASSASSESPSSRPTSDGSVLDPLLEHKMDGSPGKDEQNHRANKSRRKEQNLSKSQVIFEKETRRDLSPNMAETVARHRQLRPKSLPFGDRCQSSMQIYAPQPVPTQITAADTMRTLSYPALQRDQENSLGSCDSPPRPPPKNKHYENGSQRDTTEGAPHVPEKWVPQPPTPPPKLRRSQPLFQLPSPGGE
ncbi:dedicator of cytokinesis protein 5-like [Rhincodon typus]|uniref:dedicator of cytokinesis protein 5-like n=1 Tax=Rhincodon typus TaxID=259920 RepID=UPI00202E263E|nr:dedicator of cytokinesis protein 5-like [Rhincodon typus]